MLWIIDLRGEFGIGTFNLVNLKMSSGRGNEDQDPAFIQIGSKMDLNGINI